MIRCSVETEYAALRYTDLVKPEFVAEWNAVIRNFPSLKDWLVTDVDVEKAKAAVGKAAAEEKTCHEYKWVNGVEVALDYQQMLALGRLKGVKFTPVAEETSVIVRLEDRLRELGHRMSDVERSQALSMNAAAIIHVPDHSLLYIDEVTWLDDACTQAVQSHLDDGWRIMAVCPPASQRRPDYILGRRKSQRPLPLAYTTDPVPVAKTETPDDSIPF